MASSSLRQDASTRATQPPDHLASFHSLVDKYVNAAVLGRHARAAELSAQAADTGELLFGDDSLAVADLRIGESVARAALASLIKTAHGAEEQELLFRRSFCALLVVIAILQRRLAANTLLPGTVRKEETDYCAHKLATTSATKEISLLSPDKLHAVASTIGYNVLIEALHRSLDYLQAMFQPRWSKAHWNTVEFFVRAHLSSPLATDARPGGASSLGIPSTGLHSWHSQFIYTWSQWKE